MFTTLIDTHCHLDASEFDQDRDAVITRAVQRGVSMVIIPAVHSQNFVTVQRLAHRFDGGYYALGIHPLYIEQAELKDLEILRAMVQESLSDPRFVAVGEIGLDFFVEKLASAQLRQRQLFFFSEQLRIARDYDLPVLLHVRKAQDEVASQLRKIPVNQGIAHAFNGSLQQAQAFISLGLGLGFGGAMTWQRALRIRRLAQQLDLQHIVLETDAPDIPPAWLTDKLPKETNHNLYPSYLKIPPCERSSGRIAALQSLGGVTDPPMFCALHCIPESSSPNPLPSGTKGIKLRNEPAELASIALTLAELRDDTLQNICDATTENAYRLLPRLKAAL